MAASPASALKRAPCSPPSASTGEGGGDQEGAGAAAAAGTASPNRLSSAGSTPKRVSFQLPPPPSSAAITAAGRLLQGMQGDGSAGRGLPGGGGSCPAGRRPSPLSHPPGSALTAAYALQQPSTPAAAEQQELTLTHLPDVDAPQLWLRPLVVPSPGVCRQPNNNVGGRGAEGMFLYFESDCTLPERRPLTASPPPPPARRWWLRMRRLPAEPTWLIRR